MTPKQAAKKLGLDPSQVRRLIRQGILKATQFAMPSGYYYDITPNEIRRFKRLDRPQRGRPRKGDQW